MDAQSIIFTNRKSETINEIKYISNIAQPDSYYIEVIPKHSKNIYSQLTSNTLNKL